MRTFGSLKAVALAGASRGGGADFLHPTVLYSTVLQVSGDIPPHIFSQKILVSFAHNAYLL